MKDYFVYFWLDPRFSNQVFYVGKGKGPRHRRKHYHGRVHNKLSKILESGYTMDDVVKIVENNLSEDEALKRETHYIDKFKLIEEGGTLFNIRKNGNESGSFQKYRDNIIDDIVNEYISGNTMLSISKKYEVHETTILRYLKLRNIKRRKPGFSSLNETQLKEFLKLRKSGVKMKTLSEKYNCSINTLYRYLKTVE